MSEQFVGEALQTGGSALGGVAATLVALWLGVGKNKATLREVVARETEALIRDLRTDRDEARRHREECEARVERLETAWVEATGKPLPAYRPDLPRGGAPE